MIQGINDKNPRLVEWVDVYNMIRLDSRLRLNTEKARQLLSQGNEAGYTRVKSYVGAITPAVQCQGGRKAENIVCLTSVGMVDFDHVPADRLEEVERIVKSDPHTFLYHRTTSGHGCRIFFRYASPDAEVAYLNAWRWGNEYYSMITGLEHDPATKDANRLSFLTHDAEAFFNPDASPFCIVEVEPEADGSPTPKTSDQRIARAEQLLARQGIVYAEGNRHYYLMQLAILLVKYGVDSNEALAHMAPLCPRGDKEAKDLTQWVYEHFNDRFGEWDRPAKMASARASRRAAVGADDLTDESPKSRSSYASVEEIRSFLIGSDRLRYNVVTANLEIFSDERKQFVDVDDRTANTLWHDCIVALGKYVRSADFDKELHSEGIPAFDPFEAYFEGLPPWDGKDHISALAARVHTSNAEVRVRNAEGEKDFLHCADVRQHVAHPAPAAVSAGAGWATCLRSKRK